MPPARKTSARSAASEAVDDPRSLEVLVDVTYEAIKRDILGNRLRPGVKLTHRMLAENLGVSRTPVRASLERLYQEGYVIHILNRGYFVAEINEQEVRELYQTGYLHNHARMWLASYVVHLRKLHWRTGSDWMIAHLLDGDLARRSGTRRSRSGPRAGAASLHGQRIASPGGPDDDGARQCRPVPAALARVAAAALCWHRS